MTVIDTCSLLNLVTFYLPFDKDSTLMNFLESQIDSKEVIVIDHVYKQCGWVLGGLIKERIPFLKKHLIDTTTYLPDKKFFHLLNNDFKVNELCKKLIPADFEQVKSKFTDDADVKMLLYCNKHKTLFSDVRLLTDETGKNNDSKYFKKLPTLCEIMDINCINLPDFLNEHDLIHIKPPAV